MFDYVKEVVGNSSQNSFAKMAVESSGIKEFGPLWEKEYVAKEMEQFRGTLAECLAHEDFLKKSAVLQRRDNYKAYREKYDEFLDIWFDIRAKEVYDLNEVEKEFAKRLAELDYCEDLGSAMKSVSDFQDLLR